MEKENKDKYEKDFGLDIVSIRLVKEAPIYSNEKINSPWDGVALIGDYLSEMDREVVCVLNLRSDNTPINCHIASIGALNYSVAHPRELLKASILSNAAGIILIHNHPSGSLNPSKEDTILTDRMLNLTSLLSINLIDHIIVGGDNKEFFSFKQQGLIDNPSQKLKSDYREIRFPEPVIVANKERSR